MSTAVETPLFEISDRALAKLNETVKNEGVDKTSSYLRVAVVPGGCSGLTYDLGWDTTRQENDIVIQEKGINILIDQRSAAYIEGTKLDFSDGFEGKGFHFDNPQAIRNCACGESFGL